jgi:hypothetical protein
MRQVNKRHVIFYSYTPFPRLLTPTPIYQSTRPRP